MVTASENVNAPAPGSAEQHIALRVKDLWKRYGAVEAVRGITFDVAKGEIFGLIGPDGAGKTSTFQILAGVMEASSGTADVFGGHAAHHAFADRISHAGIQFVSRLERCGKYSLHRRSPPRSSRRNREAWKSISANV